MRSVFIHIRTASKSEVGQVLTEAYGPGWTCEIGGDQCLYIDFYRDLIRESEPEALKKLQQALGGLPSVSVSAYISGRHPGDAQVRALISTLLRRFQGRAQDEYTQHCWTLEEVMSDHLIEGHKFFDYQGWYDEYAFASESFAEQQAPHALREFGGELKRLAALFGAHWTGSDDDPLKAQIQSNQIVLEWAGRGRTLGELSQMHYQAEAELNYQEYPEIRWIGIPWGKTSSELARYWFDEFLASATI